MRHEPRHIDRGPRGRLSRWVPFLAVVSVTLAAGTAAPAAFGSSPAPGSAAGTVRAAHASTAEGASGRLGGVPRLARGMRAVGALASGTRLHVDVALEPRDPAALTRFVDAVSTPGSPLYRHFLHKGQFAGRFGPTPAAVAAVERSLVAAGLRPGPISRDHLLIPITATAGALAKAFSIGFERVRAGDRTAFTNTSAPLFSADVRGDVVGVIGLDDLYPEQHSSIPAPVRSAERSSGGASGRPRTSLVGPSPCKAAVDEATKEHAYTANELASAYQLSSLYAAGDEGAGTTIGIFELGTNSTSDIAAYQSCYGTSTTVNYIPEDGGASSASIEAALDIEDAIGLAPKATIDVFQAPDTSTGATDDYEAMVDSVNVITTSWGLCETDEGDTGMEDEETIFQEAASDGQTVFSASGDDGSEGCHTSDNSDALVVDDPSSQPYVTSVGGTSMPSIAPLRQSVWNNSIGASGGGRSAFWFMPKWQLDAPSSLKVISSTYSQGSFCDNSGGYCRETPDVSADADPDNGMVDYYDGAWGAIGGTSVGAPLWASIAALIDAGHKCGSDLGFFNPALYDAAAASYPTTFHDVTSGDNDLLGDNSGWYPAGTGYDMASGLGTPDAAGLAAAVCPTVPAAPTRVTATAGPHTTPGVGEVDLSWSVPADNSWPVPVNNGSRITGYTVSVSPSCTGCSGLAPSGRSTTISGLKPGVAYTFGVAAKNTHGTGRAGASRPITVNSDGYWLAARDGSVFGLGSSIGVGSARTTASNPVIGIASSADGKGYFVATINGTVDAFGDVRSYGDLPAEHISRTDIVAVVATDDAKGYWLVGADGEVYAFGDAPFHGDLLSLAHPVHVTDVVGMVACAGDTGYLLVGSDGGVFAFGKTHYYGSLPGLGVRVHDIKGILPSPTNTGYILVGADGGAFVFGHGVAYYGSLPGRHISVSDIVGLAITPDGAGYYMAGSNGTVYGFGDAIVFASPASLRSHLPIAGIAGV